jgi:hypothetical protein
MPPPGSCDQPNSSELFRSQRVRPMGVVFGVLPCSGFILLPLHVRLMSATIESSKRACHVALQNVVDMWRRVMGLPFEIITAYLRTANEKKRGGR